jgi:hypothetical protein
MPDKFCDNIYNLFFVCGYSSSHLVSYSVIPIHCIKNKGASQE